jgi:DNA-binding CsgD family transcriptional regulator
MNGRNVVELAQRLPTPTQLAILDRLIAGQTHAQVAAELGVSGATITNYLKTCRNRMGCKTTVELVARCMRLGMFQTERQAA